MSINNRVGFVLSNARIVVIRGCWVRWVSLCSPIGRLFVPSFGSGLRFRDWLRLVIASQTELASSFPAPLTRHWDLDTDRFVLDDRSVKSDLRPRPQDRTIDQISPYLLWVGHAGNGGDVVGLHDRGIEAVVQLAAEEPGLTLPRSLLYHRIPLGDGAGNASALLSLAVGTLASLLVSARADTGHLLDGPQPVTGDRGGGPGLGTPRIARGWFAVIGFVSLRRRFACSLAPSPSHPPRPLSSTTSRAPMRIVPSTIATLILAGCLVAGTSDVGLAETPQGGRQAIDAALVAKLPAPGTVAPGSFAFTPDGQAVTYLKAETASLSRVLWRAGVDGQAPRVVARPPGSGDTEANVSREEALRRERQAPPRDRNHPGCPGQGGRGRRDPPGWRPLSSPRG